MGLINGRWGPAALPSHASAFALPHPTRPYEDAYCICDSSRGTFAGVFDGHDGSTLSRFLAVSLFQYFEACLTSEHDVSVALSSAFRAADYYVSASLNCPNTGSTATVALVGLKDINVAYCGDSRALLLRRGLVIPLTDDHRPTRHDERERILAAGGQILWNEGERVMGVLAATRAFGDLDLRQFGVTAEPEVTSLPRHPDDELLILATDGVSHVLSNEEVADVVRRVVARATQRGASRAAAIRMAASALGRFSRDRNSKDDITVVIVDLAPPAAAPPPPPAVPVPAAPAAAGDVVFGGAGASPFVCCPAPPPLMVTLPQPPPPLAAAGSAAGAAPHGSAFSPVTEAAAVGLCSPMSPTVAPDMDVCSHAEADAGPAVCPPASPSSSAAAEHGTISPSPLAWRSASHADASVCHAHACPCALASRAGAPGGSGALPGAAAAGPVMCSPATADACPSAGPHFPSAVPGSAVTASTCSLALAPGPQPLAQEPRQQERGAAATLLQPD